MKELLAGVLCAVVSFLISGVAHAQFNANFQTVTISGAFTTIAFTDIFIVTNNSTAGTLTNYLDVGGATNTPSRYYRVRLVP